MSRKPNELEQEYSELKQYIKDCQILKRDLEYAIEDIQFTNNNGTIRYAVDFSEIFSYIFLNQTKTKTKNEQKFDFVLFGDRKLEKAPQIKEKRLESSALEELFQKSEKLILLPSYASELETFLIHNYVSNRAELEKQISIFPEAQKEMKKLSKHSDYIYLKKLLDKKYKFSEEDFEWIVNFLKKYANSLLSVIENQDNKPVNRLKQLFNSKRFEDLEKIVNSENYIDGNQKKINERFERLVELRPETPIASSRLDSRAIAMVEQANQILQKSGQKLKVLLVSRSKHMHEILEEEFGDKLSEKSILRHPRTFNILQGCKNTYKNKALQKLQEIHKAVDDFLKSSSSNAELRPDEKIQNNRKKELLKKVRKIKNDWNSATILEASLNPNWLDNQNSDSSINTYKNTELFSSIINLLEILQKSDGLRNFVTERIDKVISEWEEEQTNLWQEVLDIYLDQLGRKKDEKKEILEIYKEQLDKDQEEKLNKSLTISNHVTRYPLKLDSEDSEKKLQTIKDIKDVIRQLKYTFKTEYTYENLLIIAYSFSNLNRWKLAEIYFQQAIHLTDEKGSIPNEAYFFLAVCYRKWHPETSETKIYERNIKAIEHLNKAISLKTKKDSRYLLEKGLQILKLNTKLYSINQISNNKNISAAVGDISAAAGLELLKEAEDLSSQENDIEFKIRIYNNYLFYYTEKKRLLESPNYSKYPKYLDTKEKSEALRCYQKIKKLLEKHQPNSKKWHPSVLDTLAWSSWNLDFAKTDADRSEIIEMLNDAINNEIRPSPRELESIKNHLDRVKQDMALN